MSDRSFSSSSSRSSSVAWLCIVAAVALGGIAALAEAMRPPNQNNDIYVIQRSGAQIVAVSGFLNCDSLMCPWLSIFCYVQRDSLEADLEKVRRLRVCMKRNGEWMDLVGGEMKIVDF